MNHEARDGSMRGSRADHRVHAGLLTALCLGVLLGPQATAASPDQMYGGLVHVADDVYPDADDEMAGHFDLIAAWTQHVNVTHEGEVHEIIVLSIQFRDLDGLHSSDVPFPFSVLPPNGAGYSYYAVCGGERTSVLGNIQMFNDTVRARSWGMWGAGDFPVWANIHDAFVHVFIPTEQPCRVQDDLEGLRVDAWYGVLMTDCLGDCLRDVENTQYPNATVGPLLPGVYDLNGTLLAPPEPPNVIPTPEPTSAPTSTPATANQTPTPTQEPATTQATPGPQRATPASPVALAVLALALIARKRQP